MEMAWTLPRLHLVQMHLEPGARLVLTPQTVQSSLQFEGLLEAQRHFYMLGPFRKVPDRVTGAICHALVQCVAPWGSQLYQNQNPVCQLFAGALAFFLFPDPTPGFVSCVHTGFFLSAPWSWLCCMSPSFQSCTQVFHKLSLILMPALQDLFLWFFSLSSLPSHFCFYLISDFSWILLSCLL